MTTQQINGHNAVKPAPKSPNPSKPDAREVPEQPAGTKDRTFDNREAFPRDVDEGQGRHPRKAD